MISAKTALEALRRTTEELAESSRTEALAPEFDELAKAEAQGAFGAYEAITRKIAQMQQEGFTDPDPFQILDSQIADVHDRTALEQRSLRLRQNCAELRDSYHEFWEFLSVQFGNVAVEELARANPMVGFVRLSWTVLDAIVTEWTPEQHAYTDQMIGNMKTLLEQMQVQILAEYRGDSPLQ